MSFYHFNIFVKFEKGRCYLFLSVIQDMEKSGRFSARMKGGGGIGMTGGGRGEGETQPAPSRPYPPGIHPGGKTLKLVCVFPASYIY